MPIASVMRCSGRGQRRETASDLAARHPGRSSSRAPDDALDQPSSAPGRPNNGPAMTPVLRAPSALSGLRRNRRGFTLIEVLVVTFIIGILTSVCAIAFSKMVCPEAHKKA
jgi:prepilin-type N-terminal cleavage/methylation domain-containing protein